MPFTMIRKFCVAAGVLVLISPAMALAEHDDSNHDYKHSEEAQEYIHGIPENPSEVWLLSSGGRIYDNWWNALDQDAPENTHPSYPATAKKSGSSTWRCKECHGWDLQGTNGVYNSGSHATGIIGIAGAIGWNEPKIAAMMRAPLHGYTTDMINDNEMTRLAAFVSRGQVDMAKYVDLATRKIKWGDLNNGRAIFQGTCAACHGFDGRALDWGSADKSKYIGTEAAAAPDEVFLKILNGHPGVAMLNLRVFGEKAIHDVLSYASTLPTE